jgi:hypothetical protein
MKTLSAFAFLIGLLASTAPSMAQTLPPTTQQLQQQHDQAIQNQANAAHGNLTQLQIQTPPQPQPHLTPSGRAVSHPPGYIPTPRP